jgi:hypothetical protein
MNAQFETASTPEHRQVMIDLDACRPEYQHSTQPLSVGGISFSPFPTLKRTALAGIFVIGTIVIGTIPIPVGDFDSMLGGMETTFVFPSASDSAAEDEYSRIREEIVASGLPMLNDDEVRDEIRERRGIRSGTES